MHLLNPFFTSVTWAWVVCKLGVDQVGNCSSHEPTESLTVKSGRVILRFEFQANWVKIWVKKLSEFYLDTMVMSTKINFDFSTMLMSTKNHLLWRFSHLSQKIFQFWVKNSDVSSQSSHGILRSRAGRVEPGPDLALVTSRAGRVE